MLRHGYTPGGEFCRMPPNDPRPNTNSGNPRLGQPADSVIEHLRDHRFVWPAEVNALGHELPRHWSRRNALCSRKRRGASAAMRCGHVDVQNPLVRERKKRRFINALQMTGVQPVRQTFLFEQSRVTARIKRSRILLRTGQSNGRKLPAPCETLSCLRAFATEAYGGGAKAKAIVCSSTAAGHRSG